MVNHLRTTHYRLGLVCDWWLPNSDIGLSLLSMGIKTVSSMVSPLDQVCPINLLARLSIFIREQRWCYPTGPPSLLEGQI